MMPTELTIVTGIILTLVAFIIVMILWLARKMSNALSESTRTLALAERAVELLESIDRKLGDK